MTTRSEPQQRPHRPAQAATALVLCVVGVLAAGCGHSATGPRAGASPSSAPSPSTSPAGPSASHQLSATARDLKTVAVPPAVRRQATRGTRSFIASTEAVLTDPAKAAAPAPTSVRGAALQELESLRSEYQAEGYHIEGAATLVRQRVVRRLAHPRRLVVLACVDNSAVKVLDRSGKRVVTSTGPARSLNLLTLARGHGHWVVIQESFPDNPSC